MPGPPADGPLRPARSRKRILADPEPLGSILDGRRNTAGSDRERVVGADASRIAVLIVPTDEEPENAGQALDLIRLIRT
ncbi:MAG: hypothetical protein P8Z68_11180 [Kineosporiaceae bacterium]